MEAKVKPNGKDPLYFDAQHLVKYLKRKYKDKFMNFKLTYNGKDIPVDELDKEEAHKEKNISQNKYKLLIKGNPYKMDNLQADGWKFNGTHLVKDNKAFKVESMSKGTPLKEIKDPLDLLWAMQCLNPGLRILRHEFSDNFVVDAMGSKEMTDIKLPSGFEFENGFVTNRGNRGYCERPIAVNFTKMKGDYNPQAQEVGESINRGNNHRFEANSSAPGQFDLNGAKYTENLQHRYQEILNNYDKDALAGAVKGVPFDEAWHIYENYELITDGNGDPGVTWKGTGAHSGQVIYDERLMGIFLFMHSIANQHFSEADKNQNTEIITKEHLTHLDRDRFENIYQSYMSSPSAAVGLVKTNLVEEAEYQDVVDDMHHETNNNLQESVYEEALQLTKTHVVSIKDGVVNVRNEQTNQLLTTDDINARKLLLLFAIYLDEDYKMGRDVASMSSVRERYISAWQNQAEVDMLISRALRAIKEHSPNDAKITAEDLHNIANSMIDKKLGIENEMNNELVMERKYNPNDNNDNY